MRTTTLSRALFISVFALAAPSLASAQTPEDQDGEEDAEPPFDGTSEDMDSDGTTPESGAEPTPSDELPKGQSDDDVAPEVAGVGAPSGGLIRQAGVGGVIGYGRAGVLEMGGSAGFAFASNYRDINVSPTIGYFLADNFEISAILSISNVKADNDSSTLWSALAEPSYHIPVNRSVFGFLGLGLGASHISGIGTGFALAPRLGANLMVGRSAVLTPSLSYQYTTINTDTTMDGAAIVALTQSVRFNIGFTAMW